MGAISSLAAMTSIRRIALGLLAGSLLGALIIGIGGRLVMRLLALSIDREPAFSLGGSLEVAAYGAIVGAVAGLVLALFAPRLPGRWWQTGLAAGLLTYLGTIATLPAHIAETARPFSGHMTLVHGLFGLAFVLFGLALARVTANR